MKIKLFCGSMACLSVCWRFIIRWDLESHGIYMMLQLTTLLYFEAFDGDYPKKENALIHDITQKYGHFDTSSTGHINTMTF